MRIVSVCRGYPTHRPGGMLFVCQDRAEALADSRHHVHVLTTGTSNGPEESSPKGLTLHHLNCEPLKYSREFANECLSLVKKINPDIIHLDSFDRNNPWFVDCGYRTAITMHGFGWGSVLTDWNLGRANPIDFNALRLEQRCLSKADVVIGVSRHEHWLLRDTYQIHQAKLVYNPIPDYFFQCVTDLLPDDGYFMCASVSGGDVRGHNLVCDAAKQLGQQVKVCTNIPRRELPKLYDGCKAFVLPTAFGQGADLAVCEAIARRRPVIVTATGSYFRESEPGGFLDGCCVLLKNRSPSSIMEAMSGILPCVSSCRSDRFRPEFHANAWLEAVDA